MFWEFFPDIVGTDFICSGEEAQLDASASFEDQVVDILILGLGKEI